MKRTNLFLKVFTAVFAMNLIIVSCEKNEDEVKPSESEAEDVTIPIDENSAFNMQNFIASFEQSFVSSRRWAWDFTHDFNDGKAMVSYQNNKIYGKFGDEAQTITHNYNSEGVITSSGRTSNLYSNDIITFEYEYDLEGFITKLTKYRKEKVEDIVKLEYNEENQLIKKTHLATDNRDKEWTESFKYNNDGSVAVYENENWGAKYEYTYSNGKMTEEKDYENGNLVENGKYEYDSEGRLTKYQRTGDDENWSLKIEYSSEVMTRYSYKEDLLEYKAELAVGLKEISSYNYTYNNGIFEYCRAKENDEDGYTHKKYYYEGSLDNLQLVGYTTVDSRDDSKNYKKTKESVYNGSGTKLYYAEFTLDHYAENEWYISETNWFKADGTAITESDITEDWVFVLVR